MAKRKREEGGKAKAAASSNGHVSKTSVMNDIQSDSLALSANVRTSQHKATTNGINGSQQKPRDVNPNTHTTKTTQKQIVPTKVLKTDKHSDVKTELPTIQIVTGSYERVLHGISANITVEESVLKTTYADSFLFNAHASAVRCLALSPMPEDPSQGIYLATGGSDERVNVYSLSASPMPEADSKGRKVPSMPSLGPNKISENPMNRELGTLVQHSSSVTALHFPSRSKLLSASEDNTISVTRMRDLEVVSTVKAPKPKVSGQASGDSTAAESVPAGVNDFAIHPSMKLMVSVGRGERTMRLWNLVTGKKAGVLNFERDVLQSVKEGKYSHGEGRKIRWNKEGTEFAIAFERGVVVFGQDSKAKCALMPSRLTKVHQIAYFTAGEVKEFIAISTEDGKIQFFDTAKVTTSEANIPVLNPFAYTGGVKCSVNTRVKDFQILDLSKDDHARLLVVAGCSDGNVQLISISNAELLTPPTSEDRFIGTSSDAYSTGDRITCLVAFVMLPAHDIDGGLSEAESGLGSEVESDDSSDDE